MVKVIRHKVTLAQQIQMNTNANLFKYVNINILSQGHNFRGGTIMVTDYRCLRNLSHANYPDICYLTRLGVSPFPMLANHLGTVLTIFGWPFVKRLTPCYQTDVCPVCLFVTSVYCVQTVGWIKMKLGIKVGLGPGHSVRWVPSSPKREHSLPPQFLVYVHCGQMAGWIKMPLGTEIGLSKATLC